MFTNLKGSVGASPGLADDGHLYEKIARELMSGRFHKEQMPAQFARHGAVPVPRGEIKYLRGKPGS